MWNWIRNRLSKPRRVKVREDVAGTMAKPRKRKDMSARVAMYEAGMSTPDIAAQLGITPDAVRQSLLRRGVKMRPRGTKTCLEG